MRPGSRNRGRGRGRGRPEKQIPSLMKVKPFMTPEIEDINLELELLKKKREMITQQQNILKSQIMYSQQRQYESEKPRYYDNDSYDSPGPSRSERNFSRYYEDPAEDYIPLSSGRKRPAPDRLSGSNPKRFGSLGRVEQAFGSRLGPRPDPPPQSRKRTRETAPLAPDFPAPKKPSKAKDREAFTLRESREPSAALNGILELGLGLLLKPMKLKYGTSHKYAPLFTRDYYSRRLKKALRGRIRALLMDKYVEGPVDVVNQYRRKFPERTDVELMGAALVGEVRAPPTADQLRTEAPRAGMPCPNFFKRKMREFVRGKLKQMFSDVQMYSPPIESTSASQNADTECTIIENVKDQAKSKWKINLPFLITGRLKSMLGKYIPSITAILNMDPEYNSARASWLAATLNLDPTVQGEVVAETPTQDVQDEPAVATMVTTPKQYYAKVRGLPNLPQRSVMRPFLYKFHPSATKTHKNIKNLLYVTFDDKDHYDNFLKQDGTTIGESKLEIKVSVQANPVQSKNGDQDKNNETHSKDDIIDLDSKINELLSSIRKVEEESDVATTEAHVPHSVEGSLNEVEDENGVNETAEDHVINNEGSQKKSNEEERNEESTEGVVLNNAELQKVRNGGEEADKEKNDNENDHEETKIDIDQQNADKNKVNDESKTAHTKSQVNDLPQMHETRLADATNDNVASNTQDIYNITAEIDAIDDKVATDWEEKWE